VPRGPLALLLLGLFWLGFVSAGSGLFGWQHGLMVPAMIIPMLFRLDLYTGRASHHAAEHSKTVPNRQMVGQ
jgi:hypothetical protein